MDNKSLFTTIHGTIGNTNLESFQMTIVDWRTKRASSKTVYGKNNDVAIPNRNMKDNQPSSNSVELTIDTASVYRHDILDNSDIVLDMDNIAQLFLVFALEGAN